MYKECTYTKVWIVTRVQQLHVMSSMSTLIFMFVYSNIVQFSSWNLEMDFEIEVGKPYIDYIQESEWLGFLQFGGIDASLLDILWMSMPSAYMI